MGGSLAQPTSSMTPAVPAHSISPLAVGWWAWPEGPEGGGREAGAGVWGNPCPLCLEVPRPWAVVHAGWGCSTYHGPLITVVGSFSLLRVGEGLCRPLPASPGWGIWVQPFCRWGRQSSA